MCSAAIFLPSRISFRWPPKVQNGNRKSTWSSKTHAERSTMMFFTLATRHEFALAAAVCQFCSPDFDFNSQQRRPRLAAASVALEFRAMSSSESSRTMQVEQVDLSSFFRQPICSLDSATDAQLQTSSAIHQALLKDGVFGVTLNILDEPLMTSAFAAAHDLFTSDKVSEIGNLETDFTMSARMLKQRYLPSTTLVSFAATSAMAQKAGERSSSSPRKASPTAMTGHKTYSKTNSKAQTAGLQRTPWQTQRHGRRL